jgi:hypothetical protein
MSRLLSKPVPVSRPIQLCKFYNLIVVLTDPRVTPGRNAFDPGRVWLQRRVRIAH